jgi:hypothetical protein
MPCPGHATPGKDLVPIVHEAGWALGPVWTGTENLAPTWFKPQTAHYTNYAIPATLRCQTTINTPVLASLINILV